MTAITVYTSFCFTFVSIIAFHKRLRFLGILWQILCGLSTFNHTYTYQEYRGKLLVKKIDTSFAHIVTMASVHLALTTNTNSFMSLLMFWSSLLYMALIYYVLGMSHLPNSKWEPWHASLHIAAIVGETSLLLGYTSSDKI